MSMLMMIYFKFVILVVLVNTGIWGGLQTLRLCVVCLEPVLNFVVCLEPVFNFVDYLEP